MTIADILDLARRPGGYLAPTDPLIEILRDQGLLTTLDIGGGFVIARARPAPVARPNPSLNWRWYRSRKLADELHSAMPAVRA